MSKITYTSRGNSDYVVHVDGREVGSVIKITDCWGTSWRAFTTSGDAVPAGEQKTRVRATELLVRYSEPTSVTDIGVHSYVSGEAEPARRYLAATLNHEGRTYRVSHYGAETDGYGRPAWIVDYKSSPTGMPAFSHGDGARYTLSHVLREDLGKIVTDAVEAAGVRF